MSSRAVTAVVLVLLAGATVPARGQSWDAVLDVTPYPSPYLSDWEANPSLGTLTITNPTAAGQDVLLIYRVTDQGGRVVVSGRSDPVVIPSGPPTVITDFVNMPGSSQHDQGFEDQMRRTGRLPEGDQTICVAVTDAGGFVLAEDCVTFSVVYPDPPYLIGPIDDQALTAGHPVFQWTPLQVPPAFQLTYVVRISEVLAGQSPAQALAANIPLFETTAFGATLEYPIGAPPLEEAKTYAWWVQALDQNGYAASANEGRSEVWTFRFDPDGLNPGETPAGPYKARFTFFDPTTEEPEFWATLDSVSFPRFLEYVLLQARNGSLEIPLPFAAMFGGPGTGAADAGMGLYDEREVPGGGAARAGFGRSAAVASCGESVFNEETGVHHDAQKKSLALLIQFQDNWVVNLLECLGVPAWNRPPVDQPLAVMFAIDYGKGVPRVTLGIKPPSLDAFDLNLAYSVFVINLVGDFTMRSADYPAGVHAFYGDHEFDVWGTGVIDLGVKLGKFFKQVYTVARRDPNSALGSASADLLGQLAINFYAVAEWSDGNGPGTLGGILQRPELVLQGFKGFREKSYRGVGFGTGGLGRAEHKVRHNWYVRAAVPLAAPGFLPGATGGWFEIRFSSRDSAVARTFAIVGDTSPMETRYQVTFRVSFHGFDEWKTKVGVHPDSVLSFYTELALETVRYTRTDTATTRGRSNTVWGPAEDPSAELEGEVGLRAIGIMEAFRKRNASRDTSTTRVDTTSSTGLNVALTFGTDATFILPGNIYLHDVGLTVRRADATQPIGSTNPFQHAVLALAGDFGFGPLERIGGIEIELGRRTTTDTTRSSRRRLTPEEQEELQRETEGEGDLRRMGVERSIENRDNPRRAVEETQTVEQNRRWQFRVKLQFDQGATIGELLGWIFSLVKS